MKLVKVIAATAICTQLSGCFFVFIPGELMAKVSDGITGAEGEHCVSRAAKVGDKLRTPTGGVGTIQSLSGTSVRCSNPDMPIRAAVGIERAAP